MKNPCKDCEKRVVGCHASCEDYHAMKEQREAGRMAAWRGMEAKHFLIDSATKAIKKARKK